MDLDEFILETEDAMQKAADHVAHEMSGVRTGKASPSLVENLNVHVQSYGTTMPLRQIALISTPEARLLAIQAHDPSVVPDIERAIKESKIGITPINDGRLIRLPIPELTEERRRDITKVVRADAENARVAVRTKEESATMSGAVSTPGCNAMQCHGGVTPPVTVPK